MVSGPYFKILVDNLGEVYCAGKYGIFHYDKTSNQFYSIPAPFNNWKPNKRIILFHPQEKCIYLTEETIFSAYNIKLKKWTLISDSIGINCESLLLNSQNKIIASDPKNYTTNTTVYDCNTKTIYKIPNICGNSLFEIDKDKLLIGTWRDGVQIYDLSTSKLSKYYTSTRNFSNEVFLEIQKCPLLTGDSIAWCFTEENGIYLFNIKSKSFCGHIDGEKAITDYYITAAHAGTRYLVLGQHGLNIIPLEEQFINYYSIKGISIDNNKIIIPTNVFPYPDYNNKVLLTAQYFGAIEYDLALHKPIRFYNYNDQTRIYKIEFNYFTSAKQAKDNSYWVNTYDGFLKIGKSKVESINIEKKTSTFFPEVTHFDLEKYPCIWACSDRLAFQYCDDTKKMLEFRNCENGSSSEQNRDILFLNDTVYVATEIGIERIVNQNYIQPLLSYNEKGIFELCQVGKQKIYALADDGLYIIKDSKLIKILNQNFALSRYNYNMITSDSLGHIWMSLKSSILRYNPHNKTINHYNFYADCIQTIQNGNLLITQNNGYYILDPTKLKNEHKNSPLVIHSITTPNRSIGYNIDSKDSIFEIPWTDKSISIRYFSTQQIQNNKIEYQTFLEGLDKSWQPQHSLNSIQYTNLYPGEYTFKLRQVEDLIPNSNLTQIKFKIPAPFWMTWWFKGFTAIALFGIIFYFLLLNAQKQFAVKEKQLEVQKLKTESEIKVLRSQMNPHFIFNCLNTIEAFIIERREEDASKFLQKFSGLIRSVLENSQEEFVTIHEELKVLNWYLNLEQIRSNQKWDYSIQCTDQIEKNRMLIPPLLLQPFVENSILHGLKNKVQGRGLITVNLFLDNNNLLVIEIEDNGIGRVAAKSFATKHTHKKKSLGLDFTLHRIKNLNQDNQDLYHVEFIDLYDQNQVLGTKAILKLPNKKLS